MSNLIGRLTERCFYEIRAVSADHHMNHPKEGFEAQYKQLNADKRLLHRIEEIILMHENTPVVSEQERAERLFKNFLGKAIKFRVHEPELTESEKLVKVEVEAISKTDMLQSVFHFEGTLPGTFENHDGFFRLKNYSFLE
jgi:hypothetical protein